MEDRYLGSISRRDLLRGGLAFGVLTGLGGPRPAYAQALTGAVPAVDSLAVRVVTDSYHHLFDRSLKIGDLTVQRFGFSLAVDRPPRKALQSEWGLSLHLESKRGAETRNVLIDFGFTPEALNNNLELLGIDPARLDALVLSHGHFDHFGGMAGFLARHKARLKPGLPFYLGGEECFCTREIGPADAARNYGALDRQAIADAGLQTLYAERPSLIAEHGFTTGTIGRLSFERVINPTRMKPGMADGVGCKPESLAEAKRNQALIPDDFDHEQATCFHVKGRGLVVMTSCGHRGVINSVRRAIAASGVSKVHAVLGGFHLAPHPPEYLRETVAAFKELDPDFVIPMHCSGEPFIEIAARELGPKLVRSSTGSRYLFGA